MSTSGVDVHRQLWPGEGRRGCHRRRKVNLSVNLSTFIGNEAGVQGGAIDIGADDESPYTIVDLLFIEKIAEEMVALTVKSGGGMNHHRRVDLRPQ